MSEAVIALPGDFRRLTGGEEGILTEEGKCLQELVKLMISKAAGIRITGALAYDLGCMALGEVDARISTSVKFVDVAAGICLINSIHGKIT